MRVIRALRERGIVSVAVYSEADRDGLAVQMADEAHCIGPAPSIESYLQAGRIVDLAAAVGADAIHPGYGFLSENAGFARLCEERGIAFIGPPSAAIAAMGSKIESRRLMTAAGVPIVPGGTDPLASAEAAREAAIEIGYPVMLKASAGGGGKGMRLVREESELEAAFRGATSEARCQLQRRLGLHRTLRRAAPPRRDSGARRPPRPDRLPRRTGVLPAAKAPEGRRRGAVARRRPGSPAPHGRSGGPRRGRRELRRRGHGGSSCSIPGESFYFLEMNTRIQVEHPVTELVTGIDIVAAQLDIAAGEPAAGSAGERPGAPRSRGRGPPVRGGSVPQLRSFARPDRTAPTAGGPRCPE